MNFTETFKVSCLRKNDWLRSRSFCNLHFLHTLGAVMATFADRLLPGLTLPKSTHWHSVMLAMNQPSAS